MARPRINISDPQLKALLRLQPTLEDTAAFFECDPNTIERYIRREHSCSFGEFREQNMVHTRLTLIRTAIKQAENGNTAMLIFCLKNLCNWRDKPKDETDDSPFKNLSIEQLIIMVLQAVPKEKLLEQIGKLEKAK